jgi:hypothetical protein
LRGEYSNVMMDSHEEEIVEFTRACNEFTRECKKIESNIRKV